MNTFGDIIYFLQDTFYSSFVPMMNSFVEFFTTPVGPFIDSIADSAYDSVVTTVFGAFRTILGFFYDLSTTSLLEMMISSGITIYVVFTLFKFFWGSVDYV